MKDMPELPYAAWRDTKDTLHRWTQIVGKIRLLHAPFVNHWWHVPLYVTPHGLTTSPIPHGESWFELELDFIDHVLRLRTPDEHDRYVELRPRTVASFYASTMKMLCESGIECRIWPQPVEMVEDPIRLDQDEKHRSYDREYVRRFWHALRHIDEAFSKFRSDFIGKCSPVHFFWGSFDLAVTRFSGRRAPPFKADPITVEAYSHEVSSVGWWPGDARLERASFYSYAAPEPAGFPQTSFPDRDIYYNEKLKGFYLDHDAVRLAGDPEGKLLEFCRRTYEAAANLGGWPRGDLERNPPPPAIEPVRGADEFAPARLA